MHSISSRATRVRVDGLIVVALTSFADSRVVWWKRRRSGGTEAREEELDGEEEEEQEEEGRPRSASF
jgi:hypothetical protein